MIALFLATCCLALALLTSEASARCSEKSELAALGAAVQADLACRVGRIVDGRPSCPVPRVPACAAGAAERIVRIVLGTPSGPVSGWTSRTRRCQRDIALVSARFVARRLGERALGRRRARAGTVMRRIGRTCDLARVEENASGQPLLRVGAPCDSILGAAGADIDGHRLARCLRASLEAAVDDVAPSALPPSILLVLTDDQRHDTLDVMPATSALRDEGIHFRNAFATNPVCTPSRASILTGRYAHNSGVLSNGHFAQLDDSDTIATWLERAGYTNGLFGKYVNNAVLLGLAPPEGWHEWKSFLELSGGDFYGFRIDDGGVEKQLQPGRYSTDWLRNEVLRFMRRNAERPFFAMYATFAPHDPAVPARRHLGALPGLPPHRPPSWFDDVADKPTWVNFLRSITGPGAAARIDAFRLAQLRALLAVDEAVGRLLDKLEKLGLTDNTIVVFLSDQGLHWGEHWLQSKFNPYEESIRIPYVVRYPRRFPLPGVRDQLVLNHDLAPTLAELAGAAAPADIDGASLVPLLESASAPWRDDFLIETLGEFITAPSESVRTERWKYIDTAAEQGVTQELYDLAADPYEQTNLATSPAHAAVLTEMIARLDALRPGP